MKSASPGKRLPFAVRLALWVALVLALLIAGALTYLTLAFDPNDLKPKIADWVQSTYQRKLILAGDIRLKWWPSAHLELSRASLSQRNSVAPFASLESATVTLRLAPLLRKQIEVEALAFEGLSLEVQRFADGHWNIDDLLRSEGNSKLQVNIASLVLRDAAISVQDNATGRRLRASNLQMTAGPISFDKPGELTAAFELADALTDARVKISITNKFRLGAQPSALELSRLDVRASGQVSEVAVEQLQLVAGSLRRTSDSWELRDARLTGRGRRGPERLALQADCTQFGYMGDQWRAGGVRAQLTRELPQTQKQLLAKQELDLHLDVLHGDAMQVAAPASKLGFSSQDVLGKWSGHLLGAAAYQVQSGEWRLSKAQADARWQADAGTQLHLIGSGEVSALPIQGVWRAEGFAFTLTGTLPLGQLEASGRARASAEVPAQKFGLTLDPMQFALRNKTLMVEAKNSEPVSIHLVNDALAGELRAAQIRVRDSGLDLAGTVDLALAGTRAGSVYTFRPLAVSLSGKRAGAGMKAKLRGELRVNTSEQRFVVPDVQANAQFDSVSGDTVQVRRATISGALTVDGLNQRLRFETRNTTLSVSSLFRSNKMNEVILNGVIDGDWNKGSGNFSGQAKLDATNVKGRVGWADAAAQPSYSFDLDVDALDWDKFQADAPATRARSTGNAAAFDVEQLRAVRARGIARIGTLKANGVTAKNVALEVQ